MSLDPKIRAFDICLRKIESGASLEEALALFPRIAEELRPLLEAALLARQLGASVQVLRTAQLRSRVGFIEAARSRTGTPQTTLGFKRAWRFALLSMLIICVMLAGAASTIAVSAKALPGDALYPVKIAAEHTRLLLTGNQAQRLELEKNFDHERVNEVEALIQHARTPTVQFAGGLTQMQPGNWTVAGIHVVIEAVTQAIGNFKVGYFVEVQGSLHPDGSVLAERIRLRTFDISGKVQTVQPDRWIVNGVWLYVTPDTMMQAPVQAGHQVHVQAVLRLDGSLEAQSVNITSPTGGVLQFSATNTAIPPEPATEKPKVVAPSSTIAPTAVFVPQNTPKPTETKKATKPPKPTEVEDHQETPEPTEVEKPSKTPQPTENDDHETPRPTDDDHRTPRPTEDHHRTPRPTEEDDDHKTPIATWTAGPTRTPRPTERDDDHERTPHASPSATSQPSNTPKPSQGPSPTATPTVTPRPTEKDD